MQLDRYEFKEDEIDGTNFRFTSEGPKGKIVKLVQFKPRNSYNLYNLAFGDKDCYTGELDDKAITDNRDSKKVLATVVACVYAFTNKNPDAWIYAKGSTESRTRLYRMGISTILYEIEQDFLIYGQISCEWSRFVRNYPNDAFVIKRKRFNLLYEESKGKDCKDWQPGNRC